MQQELPSKKESSLAVALHWSDVLAFWLDSSQALLKKGHFLLLVFQDSVPASNEDQRKGVEIVRHALKQPMMQVIPLTK